MKWANANSHSFSSRPWFFCWCWPHAPQVILFRCCGSHVARFCPELTRIRQGFATASTVFPHVRTRSLLWCHMSIHSIGRINSTRLNVNLMNGVEITDTSLKMFTALMACWFRFYSGCWQAKTGHSSTSWWTTSWRDSLAFALISLLRFSFRSPLKFRSVQLSFGQMKEEKECESHDARGKE